MIGVAGIWCLPGDVLEGGGLHWSLLPAAGLCADAISGRYKHIPVRSTTASDVKGFPNAAVTWMSKSGHATNALSRIYTG
ncbi:hypothetical protein [Shewanella waksmanii]|uniref:hypothetical protein n=1 Tax=Shewanella waksmanii TaxID=213783 RepID=UPI003736BD20